MDGTTLCLYDIERKYRWMGGIVVIDAHHLIVMYRTDQEKKQYPSACSPGQMGSWTLNGND
jgi:hypothetical protein